MAISAVIVLGTAACVVVDRGRRRIALAREVSERPPRVDQMNPAFAVSMTVPGVGPGAKRSI